MNCFAFTAGSRWGRRLHHRNAKERLAPRSDSHGPQSNTGTDQRNNRDRRESNTCLLLAYFLWSLRSFLFSLDEPASTLPKFNPVFQNTAVNRLCMCKRFHAWLARKHSLRLLEPSRLSRILNNHTCS